jgi:hypothetical protein
LSWVATLPSTAVPLLSSGAEVTFTRRPSRRIVFAN